jgi:signal transduction histidine kinase
VTGLVHRRLAQAALALFLVLGAVQSDQPTGLVMACLAGGLLVTAVLPAGGWPLLGASLLTGGAVTGLCSGNAGNLGWFSLCVLIGWCALRARRPQAFALVGAATVLLLVEAVVSEDPGWASWITGTVFTLVVCLLARRQGELLAELREAQAGLAERVRAEERNRVSRELHDVIAHSLTVSLLHVTSARLALADDPAEAGEALARAEALGRQSLTEVRHAVGLLREDSPGRSPLPGAEQLPGLVEGFRQAGAPVAYEVVGDLGRLPATTGLTVYRILQESLTNAVRHGGGHGAAVRLEVGEESTELTVDSAGAGARGPDGGTGLLSMRERAEALGGRLSAGPEGDGWRVHAVLPS